MKTRTLLLASAVVLTLTGAARPAQAADTYQLDSQHSYVLFKTKHLGIGWSFGVFHQVEGSYVLDPAAPAKSSFDLKVGAESVVTGVEKRDQHLRSPDFLNAKEFPWITFRTTAVAKTATGYSLTGDFTLHGVTKPLTVAIEQTGEGDDPWGNRRTAFLAVFTIKRSEFGMTWGIDNNVVSDEIELTVSVEGVRK